MIIKGDLDRMAEDIGHAGKRQQTANWGQERRMTFLFLFTKTLSYQTDKTLFFDLLYVLTCLNYFSAILISSTKTLSPHSAFHYSLI